MQPPSEYHSPEPRLVAVHAVAILAIGAAAFGMLALGWQSPVRVLLALVFLLFGPGFAVIELLDVRDLALRVAVAVGLSLALETVVALALVYAGAYSVEVTFAIVLAFSALVLAIALGRAMRAARGSHR